MLLLLEKNFLLRSGSLRSQNQLYVTLADINKDHLYAKYARRTSRIQILVVLDVLAHSADVLDIYRSIESLRLTPARRSRGVSSTPFGCTYSWQLVLKNPSIRELIKAILTQVFIG